MRQTLRLSGICGVELCADELVVGGSVGWSYDRRRRRQTGWESTETAHSLDRRFFRGRWKRGTGKCGTLKVWKALQFSKAKATEQRSRQFTAAWTHDPASFLTFTLRCVLWSVTFCIERLGHFQICFVVRVAINVVYVGNNFVWNRIHCVCNGVFFADFWCILILRRLFNSLCVSNVYFS